MKPNLSLDVERFEKEVRGHLAKNVPVTLIGHSLGGLCSTAIFTKLQFKLHRLILLGVPFNELDVPPFLKRAVAKWCGLTLDPPCKVVKSIIHFARNAPDTAFKNILYITVSGDKIAPPGKGGLPRALVALHKPAGTLNTHGGMIFDDTTTLKLITDFIELESQTEDGLLFTLRSIEKC